MYNTYSLSQIFQIHCPDSSVGFKGSTRVPLKAMVFIGYPSKFSFAS